MILKISLRAKAGVPKTLVKQELSLHSLQFTQNTVMLTYSLEGNSVICILYLDLLRFNSLLLLLFAFCFLRETTGGLKNMRVSS